MSPQASQSPKRVYVNAWLLLSPLSVPAPGPSSPHFPNSNISRASQCRQENSQVKNITMHFHQPRFLTALERSHYSQTGAPTKLQPTNPKAATTPTLPPELLQERLLPSPLITSGLAFPAALLLPINPHQASKSSTT